MSEKNTKHRGLPPELAAIKSPTSTEEFFQFLDELIEPKDYIEKFKLHLANEYFQQNVLSFNLEELNKALSYSYIKKKYDEREVLYRCIGKDVVYPMMFNVIINKSVPNDIVYQYADILSRNGKAEELNTIYDYYQFTDNPVLKLFKNTAKPSDALIEVVIRNEPKYILETKSWDDERVTKWIKSNPEKSLDIIGKVGISTLITLPLIVQHALYDNLIIHFNAVKLNSKNDKKKLEQLFEAERKFLTTYPITYIHHLQNNHSDYLNEKLKEGIIISSNHGNEKHTMNMCQYILKERYFANLTEIEKTFSSYVELIREPIKENIGLFVQRISPIEYALRNNKYALLFPFSVNHVTEPKERAMFLATAFGCLPIHVEAKENNKKHAWYFDMYPKVITECSNEEFNKYYKALRSGALIKDLDNFKLLRELNAMPANDIKEKKIKI